MIDSASNESDIDGAHLRQKHAKILRQDNSEERGTFKNLLEKHIRSWLGRDLLTTEQRLLTGIMTRTVSRIDKLEREQNKKEEKNQLKSNVINALATKQGISKDLPSKSKSQKPMTNSLVNLQSETAKLRLENIHSLRNLQVNKTKRLSPIKVS